MLSTVCTSADYRVISEEEDYLLVDKPAGCSVHRDGEAHSLLDQIRADLKVDYLAPVHRLDKLTSGLWLLAKTPAAAAELSEQFAQRSVEKFYLALSDRKPRKKQGSVEGAIIKSRGGSYRLAREGESWSRTQFFSYGLGEGIRLYLLKPLTGRTHQIRVVLGSIGAPIIGDSRYYKNNPSLTKGEDGTEVSPEEPDRCYLHAYALCFTFAGQRRHYVCTPREGRLFTEAPCCERLTDLSEPWTLPWPGKRDSVNDRPVKKDTPEIEQ